jgi:hypothetical protein
LQSGDKQTVSRGSQVAKAPDISDAQRHGLVNEHMQITF